MKHLTLFILLLSSISLWAGDFSIDTVKITSSVLNETRTILVFKPSGIQPTDTVILIYLLDGEKAKYRYEMIAVESFEKPVIGIGIINTNRNRDMLPANEPDKFLDFIENELIHNVEAGYRIEKRILFGHSFAGGFTIYSMIHKPGLFGEYIASSPTPIMDFVDPAIYKKLNKSLNKRIQFYFSYGTKDMAQVKKWGEILFNNLLDLDISFINWKNDILIDKNHNNSDVVSLINGLKH
jgi:predicted alpha/beta superfamily hydrolase